MLINDFVCKRIEPDKELFEKISTKCKLFFEKAILPELLAKCFSNQTSLMQQVLEKCLIVT